MSLTVLEIKVRIRHTIIVVLSTVVIRIITRLVSILIRYELDSEEPPSLLLFESRPSIVCIEFGEALLSSSSTWWSIRVSESQLSIKLSETVNARGSSLDEFPAEPVVVAIGCYRR